MTATDFERKLNLLLMHIRQGMPKSEAEKELEEVLKYAIFDCERTMAKDKVSAAIKCIAM
jgi:hypothetical protein